MNEARRRWTVRLSAAAESDFTHIVEWTVEHFGAAQALVYAETISLAMAALSEGPSITGARARHEILKGLYSLHVARQGRKGRHFIMYRLDRCNPDRVIEVLRVLHDSMDLPRHLDTSDQ